jgi:hypothetical protein
MDNMVITIPSGDYNRAFFFDDPIVGIEKSIYIVHNDIETEYDQHMIVTIHMNDGTIRTRYDKIISIHNNLRIMYGVFQDELPEQRMVVRYLTGSEKVLEIGGNIGRNSLVIASIVGSTNLVTLESNVDIARQLEENRNLNNFTFHIEESALSKRALIQKDWCTIPSDVLQEGYVWVHTIQFDELQQKYNITFDTFVVDCEGALYYILMDMPHILQNIQMIIMENDYHDISHKEFVDSILKKYSFYNEYTEAGGWGCCYNNFFEVWKKS